MGARGKEKVTEAFGVERIARQVADVYDKVLGGAPKPANDVP
jgi:hypothetical protein